MDKAFRFECTITVAGKAYLIDRNTTQADQGSDMNIISKALAQKLGLGFHPLAEIGFHGLAMRTADNRNTQLHHWVWIKVTVEGITREVRCLVAPDITAVDATGRVDQLSLILGMPWLWDVDALISIRKSSITIGDSLLQGETPRDVKGPEMVFCKDHNLLLYPKAISVTKKKHHQPQVEDATDSSSESDSDSDDGSDDLSDIDDPKPPFH